MIRKLQISQDSFFSELDLAELDEAKFSVYVLDHQWNYLFVNQHVKSNLGERGQDMVGKNMWQYFSELSADFVFQKMKQETENGLSVNFTTTSPINGQRLNIVGYPLKDCYFFYASQLPRKDELLNELRSTLEKK